MKIVFDIDGTLADCTERREMAEAKGKETGKRLCWATFFDSELMATDKPIETLCELALDLYLADRHDIFFVTGRPERFRDITEDWLLEHTCFPLSDISPKLYMRPDGDYRPDVEIKTEILDRIGKVDLAFENRSRVVEMWRGLGVRCCQVDTGDF